MCGSSDGADLSAIESLLQLAVEVFEHSSEGIFVANGEGAIIAVNRAFTRISGYMTTDVLGRNPAMLGSRHHDDDFFDTIRATLDASDTWRGEVISRRKSGELFSGWMTVAAVRDDAGSILRYVAIFSDITAFKMADERLRYLAQHDFLTGLANRASLEDRFERALLRAQRFHTAMAVLLIDLDGFKRVNDSHGHATGDGLLLQVAQRLHACVRQTDTAARLGGDEFVVLMPDLQSVAEAERVAREIVVSLSCVFVIDGTDVRITASVGVGGFPDHGSNPQALFRVADAAMYAAKREGGNGFRFALPLRPAARPVWETTPPQDGGDCAPPRAPRGLKPFDFSVGHAERPGEQFSASLTAKSGSADVTPDDT